MEKRKKIRLKGYDYSQDGIYFVTICTCDRERGFWEGPPVGQGLCPCLSSQGAIVQQEIERLTERFPCIYPEKYVVMDNHVHILLTFKRQGQSPCPTLGAVMGAYKSITTKRVNEMGGTPGRKLWQFRYYNHIIRDENDFMTRWNYIDTNPARWQDDEYCEG